MTTEQPDSRAALVRELYADRVLAHAWLFSHRHPHPDPPYKADLVRDFHSSEKHRLDMVFRGGAKSSTAEEAIVIRAQVREFRYALIVGATFDRAVQRLHSVRYELETNDKLKAIFGDQIGPIWSADQLLLSNGVMIQALGRGQSLRGVKHLEHRPDFLFGDDLEDFEDVDDERRRNETWRWFNYDLMRALDPSYLARVAATPLDPDALPLRLERNGWVTRRIPVYYLDQRGERVSSWPERFPLTRAAAFEAGDAAMGDPRINSRVDAGPAGRPVSIEEMEDLAAGSGTLRRFRAEMLCEAEAADESPFPKQLVSGIVHPRTPTFEAVYAMLDPARTVRSTSSLTGCAVWSWLGTRLIIWECWQRPLLPAEMIDAMFELNGLYRPVMFGVEIDGLEEMILQPLRTEQVRRGVVIPIQGMRAPKGKYDFIRALHPWFAAHEVQYAKPLYDLERALTGFPSGKIDAANALAYAPMMRGGSPIFREFASRHIAPDLEAERRRKTFLAVNATRTMTTAALMQFIDGAIRIYRDWMADADPAEAMPIILKEARLEAGGPVSPVAPPQHFDRYQSVGLTQACARANHEVVRGSTPSAGRQLIRDLLKTEIGRMPGIVVSDTATWTLRGFSGGYRLSVNKQGILSQEADQAGAAARYKLLMEGIESFMGLTEARLAPDEEEAQNYATTPGGARYATSLPMRRG